MKKNYIKGFWTDIGEYWHELAVNILKQTSANIFQYQFKNSFIIYSLNIFFLFIIIFSQVYIKFWG